jgi:hypothetical protein
MAHDETVDKRTVKLAHKVRKLHEVLVRGTDKERQIARERLENLLTENRKTWSDLLSLLAISLNNPERTMDDRGDDDPPPPTPAPQGDDEPDAFSLVDWMLRRFLFLQDHQFTALALWILHTFVFNEFGHSPRLALLSPVRGCGKSVALDLCEKLCLRARKFGSATTAVLPRLIHNGQSTVLLDEGDNLDFAGDPVLRAVLNDGFKAGARRALMIKGEATEFGLFAPIALAAIGRLPLPLMSRSIAINMSRAPRKARLERFDVKNRTLCEELDVVYRIVFAWSLTVRGKLDTDPKMPDRFYGRLADRWRGLFAIADALGHGKRARDAAKVFSGEHADEDVRVTLLSDIHHVFGTYAENQITVETLLEQLLAYDEGHWSEFRGENGDQAPRPLTRSTLVKMISAFGIRTRTAWPRHRTAETKSARGYLKPQFEAAWASYCDQGDTSAQPSVVRHLRRS